MPGSTLNRITVGCRVKGSRGELVANPNPNIKRRVRAKVVGTVINSNDKGKWVVRFDYNMKSKECHSSSLVVVDNLAGIPTNELPPLIAHESYASVVANIANGRDKVCN